MGVAAGSESNGTWTQLPSPPMETGSESNGIWIQLPSPPTTAAAAAAAAVAAATAAATAAAEAAASAAAGVGSSSGGGGGGRGRNAAQLAGNVRHGRIDEELLLAELPPPPDTTRAERMQDACQVVVCGPESMLVELCGRRARDGGTNYGPGEEAVAQARHPAIGGVLRRLGYRSNQVAWL
jgi:hypothetical protein